MKTEKNYRFDGSDYVAELDQDRLTRQIDRIFDLMSDTKYRTLGDIEETLNIPQASISAHLRSLRKKRFGEHTVLKQRTGDPAKGLFEYKLIVNESATV